MKQRLVIAWLSVAMTFLPVLSACGPLNTASNQASDELIRQVEALGFRGDMAQDLGDYVLVEGDIRLDKHMLESAESDAREPLLLTSTSVDKSKGSSVSSLQYHTNYLVDPLKVHQIRVDLSALDAQSQWKSAAKAAMVQWSNVPQSYVRMSEGTSPDISVQPKCLPKDQERVAANGDYPFKGKPGAVITVNTCFYKTLNSQQLLHNMVHEFGHTLGFRHTNWQSRDESASGSGAVHIPGTPNGEDKNSVMNGGTASNQWAGFSTFDQTATRTLYPIP